MNNTILEKYSIIKINNFPKSFGMIGISEEKKIKAYLNFYYEYIDYTGEENEKDPIANFIKKYYKYNFY